MIGNYRDATGPLTEAAFDNDLPEHGPRKLNLGPVGQAGQDEIMRRIAGSKKDKATKSFSPDQPRDDHGRWTSGDEHFTSAKKEQLAGYQNDSAALSAALYDGSWTKDAEFKKTVSTLDKMLAQSVVASDAVVYRGLGNKPFQAINDFAADHPDGEFKVTGFQSTSMDRAIADHFMSNDVPVRGADGQMRERYFNERGGMLVIELPKGSNALNVNKVLGDKSEVPEQKELILGRNSTYQIMSVEESPPTIRVRLKG